MLLIVQAEVRAFFDVLLIAHLSCGLCINSNNKDGTKHLIPSSGRYIADCKWLIVMVACLQAQLMQVKAQLTQNLVESRNIENNHQRQGNNNIVTGQLMNHPFCPTYINPISPQSSLDSIDHNSMNDGMSMQDIQSREDFQIQAKERPYNNNDLGELQELTLRMIRN
ncbi:hypothetical protein JHK86_009973 [Glycine max]|nr:hypothetical protein JHK86_009973 [Glycine max]